MSVGAFYRFLMRYLCRRNYAVIITSRNLYNTSLAFPSGKNYQKALGPIAMNRHQQLFSQIKRIQGTLIHVKNFFFQDCSNFSILWNNYFLLNLFFWRALVLIKYQNGTFLMVIKTLKQCPIRALLLLGRRSIEAAFALFQV